MFYGKKKELSQEERERLQHFLDVVSAKPRETHLSDDELETLAAATNRRGVAFQVEFGHVALCDECKKRIKTLGIYFPELDDSIPG